MIFDSNCCNNDPNIIKIIALTGDTSKINSAEIPEPIKGPK